MFTCKVKLAFMVRKKYRTKAGMSDLGEGGGGSGVFFSFPVPIPAKVFFSPDVKG